MVIIGVAEGAYLFLISTFFLHNAVKNEHHNLRVMPVIDSVIPVLDSVIIYVYNSMRC
jgi:hypothetical protein